MKTFPNHQVPPNNGPGRVWVEACLAWVRKCPQLRLKGASFRDIGDALGVTRQCAHQSIHRLAQERGLLVPKPPATSMPKQVRGGFTPEQIHTIRSEYSKEPSFSTLAQRYGVTTMTIWRIVNNRTYKEA